MFVVNSRLGFSSVAACRSIREGLHNLRPSFSRSYGCILPSSLTRVFPRTLGFSPRLPVSVLVRVHVVSLEAFLGSVVRLNLTCTEVRVYLSVLSLTVWGFASTPAYRLRLAFPIASSDSLLRHSIGLGPDLPWDDERCPGSLRLSVGQILTDRFATHTGILTSIRSSCPSGQPSTPMERSPTHACACRDFGSVLEPRIFSAQGLSTSELLRTL